MRNKRFLNIHWILLVIVVLTVGAVVFRFLNWGELVNIDDFASEYKDEYNDSMDIIFPVLDKDGNMIQDTDGVTTIVCFGNAPFADDRDSSDNLANMIASKTGATVYNCSIGDSYLAMQADYVVDAVNNPMDIFTFYWLSVVAIKGPMEQHWENVRDVMGDDIPPEALDVYKTLSTLDFNSVDVVAVMYDATDYLQGHMMYNEAVPTDITQFSGNLEAGLVLLAEYYPHIRFIVMSPTYAYAVDEAGNYASSDIYTYGQDVLSTYSIRAGESCTNQGVTFIDHLYGTITEDNAREYLVDNLHLNVKGRELVADRFIKALRYFDPKDSD